MKYNSYYINIGQVLCRGYREVIYAKFYDLNN